MSRKYRPIDERLEVLGLRGKPGVKALKKILREQARYITRAQRNPYLRFEPKRVALLASIAPKDPGVKAVSKFGRKKKLTMVGPDGKPLK